MYHHIVILQHIWAWVKQGRRLKPVATWMLGARQGPQGRIRRSPGRSDHDARHPIREEWILLPAAPVRIDGQRRSTASRTAAQRAKQAERAEPHIGPAAMSQGS